MDNLDALLADILSRGMTINGLCVRFKSESIVRGVKKKQ